MKDTMSPGLKVAVLMMLLLMLYLTGITFFPTSDNGSEFAKTILPYFLSLIGVFVGYYWGSSSKGTPAAPNTSQETTTTEITKNASTPPIETGK